MPGGDLTAVLHQKIDRLNAELDDERAKVKSLEEALKQASANYDRLDDEVCILRAERAKWRAQTGRAGRQQGAQ